MDELCSELMYAHSENKLHLCLHLEPERISFIYYSDLNATTSKLARAAHSNCF